jgi:coenzyme F420-dependent glucose-6-phosphate dehydrogenase
MVRPEDFDGRMLISSDLEKHRTAIQKFLDLGFDQVYLHNVGRNQNEWIEAFGHEVLPKLTA